MRFVRRLGRFIYSQFTYFAITRKIAMVTTCVVVAEATATHDIWKKNQEVARINIGK